MNYKILGILRVKLTVFGWYIDRALLPLHGGIFFLFNFFMELYMEFFFVFLFFVLNRGNTWSVIRI